MRFETTFALTLLLACGASPGRDESSPQPVANPESPVAAQYEAAQAPEQAPVEDKQAPEQEPGQAPEPEPSTGLGPLTDEQRKAFRGGPEDLLATGTEVHYIKSNEIRHDLFFPYIRDKGGAFVGVGIDPNYTLIAVAKPEYVFLLDIDFAVLNLHRIYEVFIEESPDPETLHARFHKDSRKESLELLERKFADLDPAHLKMILRSYKAGRETVYRHLKHVIKRKRDGVETSWLSNPEYYETIRQLFELDRIRVMPGDLRGKETMPSIAAATKALGVPVRVMYMSNAEEYLLMYPPQFKDNMQAFPVDEQSVLCRTVYTKPKNSEYGHSFDHADSLWNYQVHDARDYQRRLSPKFVSRNRMLKAAEADGTMIRKTGAKGHSVVGVAVAREFSPVN